ncbi:ankyrin repeat domain-containing protein [Halodesulfovibrio aestuarii]|uniref:ankyrin repeat domain-containing protein n=1 Tax=Halodesulfovibrio aestuarii TaxID=126333 RepID=UPI00054E82A5
MKLSLSIYKNNYMELIQSNNVTTIQEILVKSIVSPNKFNFDDFTSPLSLACELGYYEMAQTLLCWGADVGSDIETQIPPLHAAIRGGHLRIVKLLVSHGADIESQYGVILLQTCGHIVKPLS